MKRKLFSDEFKIKASGWIWGFFFGAGFLNLLQNIGGR
ncbi:hypothetical protein AOP6_2094 [Desulfuromonas sp. AOP6]|nr:hypothetical protein AOP6_2094 [Desulfuromonas sp. AOP6]